MLIEIPGYKGLKIKNIVLDYNGTVAVDGSIKREVKDKLEELSKEFDIFILTADTYGNARENCSDLPVEIKTFPGEKAADFKKNIVHNLGSDNCACVGNGRNDLPMFKEAIFSIAVIGKEGAYAPLLLNSDICVCSILDALDLFLNPTRVVAGLRG